MGNRIDVLAFLAQVVEENTTDYRSDFQYDVRMLTQAAQEKDMRDRVFYWMSRPSGTWCVKEREVFLQGSGAHSIWTYYADQPEGIRAYRVTITGMEGRKVMGQVIGGVVLVAALAVMALIAALLASPFGIFFSNEPSRDAVPLNAAIAQINVELADELETLQTGDYDSIDIQGQPPAWKEVVAVFAVKTAGGDDGVDVAALTPDRIERLRAVFWDMCQITTETETVEGEDSTETILHITITPKTADDMRTIYSFSEFQNKTLTELLEELDALDGLLGDLAITQADAVELLQNLPGDLSPERRAVVETACKLVDKVNYFWGGKSLVLGWDSRWGQLSKVWADGNSTTGTYRPYGLDCSGFVDWTFYNVSNGEYVIGHGGGARMQHTYCTSISWEKAQPGDLVFYPEDTHVGIVGGRDENGNLLIVHCASGANNVVITGLEGFTSIGRPLYYGE